MRKFVNVTHTSLDGVMERMEDWHFDYVTGEDVEAFTWETLEPCDTLVLGRRTYDGFAEAWPGRDGKIANQLNSMHKIVVSTTADAPSWTPATVWTGDLTENLTDLKNSSGGDVMTYGIGPVVHAMITAGLLDELHIGINPILAGGGNLEEMLIREGTKSALQLVETRSMKSGIVIVTYQPIRP
jgi:dihydrofolate reductase